MDDTPALRRTIRRVTAVLVGAIALLSVPRDAGGQTMVALGLLAAVTVYLVASLTWTPQSAFETDEDAGSATASES